MEILHLVLLWKCPAAQWLRQYLNIAAFIASAQMWELFSADIYVAFHSLLVVKGSDICSTDIDTIRSFIYCSQCVPPAYLLHPILPPVCCRPTLSCTPFLTFPAVSVHLQGKMFCRGVHVWTATLEKVWTKPSKHSPGPFFLCESSLWYILMLQNYSQDSLQAFLWHQAEMQKLLLQSST